MVEIILTYVTAAYEQHGGYPASRMLRATGFGLDSVLIKWPAGDNYSQHKPSWRTWQQTGRLDLHRLYVHDSVSSSFSVFGELVGSKLVPRSSGRTSHCFWNLKTKANGAVSFAARQWQHG